MPKKNYVLSKTLEIIKEHSEPRAELVYGCPECRNLIKEDASTCPNCGKELNWDNEREWRSFYKDIYGEY